MSNIEVAQRSARGSTILLIGNFLATGINAIAVIIVARLLGPDRYGIYSLSFVAPGLLLLVVGIGVNTSVTRYSAYYLSVGRRDKAETYTRSAILFLVSFGIALTALNYLLAGFFSSTLLVRSNLTTYVRIASLGILGNTMLNVVVAAATGWNMMGLAGASQVVQSVVKLVAAPGLVLAGYDVFGAIDGHVISLLLAGLAGILFICLTKLKGLPLKPWHLGREIVDLVRFGIPVFIGALIYGLATYYVTILLAVIASNAVFGYYQAAAALAITISLIAISISGALYPAFASLSGTGGDVRTAFDLSLRYTSYLIVPIATFLIASAPVLLPAVYGSSFSQGSIYLELLALSFVPVAAGSGLIPVYFNGLGKTRLTLYVYIASSLTLVVAAPLLALYLGLNVDGLIYALLLGNLVTLGLGLTLAKKRLSASADLRKVLLFLVSSAISGICVALLPRLQSLVFTLILQLAVFAFLYTTLAPLMRALDKDDMERLRLVMGRMRGIGSISGRLFDYQNALLERFGSKSK